MGGLDTTKWILEGTIGRIRSEDTKIEPEKLKNDALEIMKRVVDLGEQNKSNQTKKIWLVYWRVQSWKTNAMMASTALAFDNGYKIAIILTSNNKELVTQTRERFEENLYGTEYFIQTVEYKELRNQKNIPIILQWDDVRLVLVVSKGATALETTIEFLSTLWSNNYKTIVFDDEGDNYSLDNNRKDRDEEEDLPPTRINDLIFSRLAHKIDHVFVSVTGTPQWVLLEWTNQSLGFKYLLEPGDWYVWGKDFFSDESVIGHPYIHIIDPEEVIRIYETWEIREWLANALMTFYTVSTLFNRDKMEKGQADGYAQFLCHPDLKVDFHKSFHSAIQTFHNSVMMRVMDNDPEIREVFRRFFDHLKTKDTRLHFDNFYKLLRFNLIKTSIVQLNALHKDSRSKWKHEILIGWNILWRWVTIKNMLVMYYGRNAKITNMDTLYQHARMFWYRRPLLHYMKIYMPEDVYQKFHFTYETDEWLRDMVSANPYEDFPIKYYDKTWKLRFTRPNVESKSFLSNVFIPRKQFYPNHISFELHKENERFYETIQNLLGQLGDQERLEGEWILVDLGFVQQILGYIKTSSTNKWQDGKVAEMLSWLLSDSENKKIRLFTSKAEKRSWLKLQGSIPSGTLHSSKVEKSLAASEISLWLSSFNYEDSDELGKIWYPTIVFPESFAVGKIYLLNK